MKGSFNLRPMYVKRNERTKERYLKVCEENPDSTDLIMKTMGLSPLGPFNSVDKTKLSLKIAQSNNSILSDAIDAITKRIAAA